MPVLVLGGSGFIGRAIQEYVLATHRADDFVFAYRNEGGAVDERLRRLKMDMLDPGSVAQAQGFDRAIWVAGTSDHALGWRSPLSDLESTVVTLLRFLAVFRGSLVLLSSQAVYFGLSGCVPESVDHVPSMPYGLSKLVAERQCEWALERGELKRLWIHRLMYAFAPHERPERLLKRCLAAERSGCTVTVFGGGRSYLNPLPASFVAEVLVRSSDSMESEGQGFLETTNLNHRECWTVADVIECLQSFCSFKYELMDGGERWPVRFWGDTARIGCHFDRWGLEYPAVPVSLKTYCDRARKETT